MTPQKLFLNRWFFIACVIVAALCYVFVDRHVGSFVWGDMTAHTRRFFSLVSSPGKAIYALVALVVLSVFGWLTKCKKLMWICVYIILAIVISGIVCDILKIGFGRARPTLLANEGIYGFTWLKFSWEYWSFPSGHSTTIASICLALGMRFARFAWLFLLLGVVVAICRVMAGAHYPSDVMTGFYLGSVVSIWLYPFFSQRLS